MVETVLKVSNLSKNIKGTKVVDNIAFTLNKGDVMGFLGPNGAGKSTTIKMILGLVRPSSGEVRLNNFNIVEDREAALQTVGAMVEYPSFYGYMSGYKNLELYASLYGLKKSRVDEVMDLVNLSQDKDKKVKKYSLGMKQRLGIARAFLNHPQVVILDEPTNGLDPVGVIETRKLIKELALKEKVTFLICSHILSEMQSMCNKIAIINKGKIIAAGNVNELLTEKKLDKLEDYYLSVLEGIGADNV